MDVPLAQTELDEIEAGLVEHSDLHLVRAPGLYGDALLLLREVRRLRAGRAELLAAAEAVIEGAESQGWDRYKGTDEPRTGIAALRTAIRNATDETRPGPAVHPGASGTAAPDR